MRGPRSGAAPGAALPTDGPRADDGCLWRSSGGRCSVWLLVMPMSRQRSQPAPGGAAGGRVPARALVLLVALAVGGSVSAPAATAANPISSAGEAAVSEVRVSAVAAGTQLARERAFEPVLATHPTDPDRLAAVYQRHLGKWVIPALRISRDGGQTWADTKGRPWAGSGRSPGLHASIAWGPGPAAGSARLYWADTTAGGRTGGHLLSVAWSDDEGRTWSRLHVERRTPPWIGGFPDITVDRHPASPNYGAVYVVYNWPASATRGPGLRLLASPDFGRSWLPLEIPAAAPPAGFPAAWRIDYRVRAAPDGSVYVASFQANLRRWDSSRIFWTGGLASVGRVGFAVARVELDRASGRFALHRPVMATTLHRNVYTALHGATPGTTDNLADPMWSLGLDVDPASGLVVLAVGDIRASRPRGIVRVGRSSDGGATWGWVTLPSLPAVGGRPQSSYRPNVVASDGLVFVGLRGITDVAAGLSPALHGPTIGLAYSLSLDGGATFSAPVALTTARWNAGALDPATNGPGLRERAEQTADGTVVYAYADGRLAAPRPSARYGRATIFAVRVRVPAAGPLEAARFGRPS